jgi:nucleoporin NUP159
LFGIVLVTGQLPLANLKSRELVKTGGGNAVFHEDVALACWSRLGKKIVAGKNDGTAVQIDQAGNVKAEITVPPKLLDLYIG